MTKEKLLSIKLIELLVSIYDIITLPVYYLLQQPWRARRAALRVRAKQVDEFEWCNIEEKLDRSDLRTVDTLDEMFRESVATYASRKCLGVRKVLAVEYKSQPPASKKPPASDSAIANGKTPPPPPQTRAISKYVLANDYTWFTYRQIEEIVVRLSAGLVDQFEGSLVNGDGWRKLLICADTCMQWFLMAHACFRNNITVVTAYTSLDDEAVLHSIQQTEIRVLVVSQKFAKRLPKILTQAPLIDTVIILDEPMPGERNELNALRNSLLNNSNADTNNHRNETATPTPATNVKRITSYQELLQAGANVPERIVSKPSADNIAVLMYTSGSTGKAKGVMLSHSSIVYTALSFSGPGDISHEDRYIGYLPLGHVLELAAECIFLRNGSTIAYSSPFTLTNHSPMIKQGQHGDAYIFRPTIMGAVPLVLDRIRSSLQAAIKARGPFYDQLFNDFVIRYKRYWWERYYDTPLMNLILCRPFNMILGGKIRAICSGGAALSRETQEYLRHVTNYTVLQGYGLTETSAAASFCDVDDRRYNVVGAPYPIVRLRLETWSDYSVHDKPYPRGEIIIGGRPVSMGYYKLPELTEESFYTNPATGLRYFRSGDIGLMLPDGVLKIIDRKKDIVKPLSGEYISLSEIETAMRTVPIVENICAYCSQYSNHVVALVKPDQRELRLCARQLFAGTDGLASEALRDKFRKSIWALLGEKGSPNDWSAVEKCSHETLCDNEHLTEHCLKLLQTEGERKRLKWTHIPSQIKLVKGEWSPESGLVTASFKLRRRELERLHADDIKQLYLNLGQTIDQNTP